MKNIYRLVILGTAICLSACNSASPVSTAEVIPVAGQLQLSSFSESNILSNGRGFLASGTLSLNGSSNVSGIVVSSVTSNNNISIATNPSPCILSSANNSCTITVSGESAGTAMITESAAGYPGVTSATLNVYQQQPSPALISNTVGLTPDSSVNAVKLLFSGLIESATLSTADFIVSNGGSTATGSFVTESGESAVVTFSPAPHLNFGALYSVATTAGILDIYGQPVESLSPQSFTTQESYLIYVADAFSGGWTGNLQAEGHGINGIDGADNICQAFSQCPLGASCKAMIVDQIPNRTAAPVPFNWVLQANTPYMNTDGYYIGTTTPDEIFTFPLNDGFSHVLTPSKIRTGLQNDWTTYPDAACNSWTESAGGVFGMTGSSNNLDPTAINYYEFGCLNSLGLYCVQQ